MQATYSASEPTHPGPAAAGPEPITVATVKERRLYSMTSRARDVIMAGVLLVVGAPLLLLLLMVIRVETRGNPLYRQRRVGRDGVEFDCWKLRTMQTENDDEEHRTYLQYLIENSSSVVAERLPSDPRITRVGRFLRKSSLDELPQLWNVLRGDMSLVGPRPPIPYEVAHYQAWQLRRLAVRPGLTGAWQVVGRGRVTFDAMCRMDLSYIAARSFWMDLVIILRTPWALLSGRGAG